MSKRESITLTQEILGVYLIPNVSPDYEGIYFYLEDGTFQRVGLNEAYTPNLSDFTMFDARLIGFSAKFAEDSNSYVVPGEMGLITD